MDVGIKIIIKTVCIQLISS